MALFDIGRILSRTVINTPLLSTLHRFFMAAAPKNFSSFPTKILPLNCSQLATSRPRVTRNNEATLVNEPDAQRDNPLIEFALSHSFGNRPVIRRIDFFFSSPSSSSTFSTNFSPSFKSLSSLWLQINLLPTSQFFQEKNLFQNFPSSFENDLRHRATCVCV